MMPLGSLRRSGGQMSMTAAFTPHRIHNRDGLIDTPMIGVDLCVNNFHELLRDLMW